MTSVKDESVRLPSPKRAELVEITPADFTEALTELNNNPELVRQITLASIAKVGDHRKIGEF